MKLSLRERRVFTAAQFRTDASIQEIAEICGYREHAVRYVLQSLRKREVFVTRSMVNVRLLGLTRFAIFFSMAKESRKIKRLFFDALKEDDHVAWIREFGGEFPYVFDIVAPTIDAVTVTLDRLTQRFGNIFFEKSLAVRYHIVYFERSYLAPEIARQAVLEEPPLKAGQKLVEIDEFDHKILSAISTAPDASDVHLARQLQIPRSTVLYRMQQLRKDGVLLPTFLDLNPRLAGICAYRLLIRTRGSWAHNGKLLFKYFQGNRHFVSLIMCMGAWDFETTIEVEDPRAATGLVADMYEQFAETIGEIKLLPVFEEPKDIMYPFRSWPMKW